MLGNELGDFLVQLKDANKQAIKTVSFGFELWYNLPSFMHDKTVPEELEECTGRSSAWPPFIPTKSG
jgi:hypothetical protein